jgi:hypothetical protein
MKLTTMAEHIEMKAWMALREFVRRDTAVTEAFLQHQEKPHIAMVAGPAVAGLK